MSLSEFLDSHRDDILDLCEKQFARAGSFRSSTPELRRGLSLFYDELVEVLRGDAGEWVEGPEGQLASVHGPAASRQGKESLRLGFTISQVVHGYGALCQAVTYFAAQHNGEPITAREFNRLNSSLDVAIAEAVAEFSRLKRQATAEAEVLRLGFLAHELRNALGAATTSHALIKRGVVGTDGSTSNLLDRSLAMMRDLIDRSLSEVRLRGTPAVLLETYRVIDLVGEVEVTAGFEAGDRKVSIRIEVDPGLKVDADRHLFVSALSNLVHNAVRFSRAGGTVQVRGRAFGDRALIEVEDECGGLPPGRSEELFLPFVQKGSDRSGAGLGLSIARRSVELNEGTLSVRNLPGRGCVFTIELARATGVPESLEPAG